MGEIVSCWLPRAEYVIFTWLYASPKPRSSADDRLRAQYVLGDLLELLTNYNTRRSFPISRSRTMETWPAQSHCDRSSRGPSLATSLSSSSSRAITTAPPDEKPKLLISEVSPSRRG